MKSFFKFILAVVALLWTGSISLSQSTPEDRSYVIKYKGYMISQYYNDTSIVPGIRRWKLDKIIYLAETNSSLLWLNTVYFDKKFGEPDLILDKADLSRVPDGNGIPFDWFQGTNSERVFRYGVYSTGGWNAITNKYNTLIEHGGIAGNIGTKTWIIGGQKLVVDQRCTFLLHNSSDQTMEWAFVYYYPKDGRAVRATEQKARVEAGSSTFWTPSRTDNQPWLQLWAVEGPYPPGAPLAESPVVDSPNAIRVGVARTGRRIYER